VEVALRDVFAMPVLARLADHLLDAQLAQFDQESLARLAQLPSSLSPAKESPT
jgi:hypothetical protein